MGQFWPHGHLLKRLNSPLSIIFLKNKLHHDNHRTMYCMFLKYKISCHIHFKHHFMCLGRDTRTGEQEGWLPLALGGGGAGGAEGAL